MSNGRVDEAAADRAVHPAADERSFPARRPLNRQLDPGQARFWRWHVGGQLLDERAIDLGHGTHLVIDASPGCHFCANAVVDIDKDPMLARCSSTRCGSRVPNRGSLRRTGLIGTARTRRTPCLACCSVSLLADRPDADPVRQTDTRNEKAPDLRRRALSFGRPWRARRPGDPGLTSGPERRPGPAAVQRRTCSPSWRPCAAFPGIPAGGPVPSAA